MLSLLLLACSSAPPTPPAVEPPAPPPTAAAPPPPPTRDAPSGALWLQTEHTLVRLDGTGGTAVEGLPGPIDGWTLGPDGVAWVAVDQQLFRVDGTTATMVASLPDDALPIGAEDLAVGADGAIWVVGARGLVAWTGGTWSAVPADALGPDPTSLSEVVVGPDGRVVARGNRGVLLQQDGGWVHEDLSEPFPGVVFLHDLTITADGAIWLQALGEDAPSLLVRRDGGWSADPRELSFGVDGRALAVDADGGLVLVQREGGEVVRGRARLSFDDTVATSVEGLVVDGRNRVWAATRQGLLRWDEDGTVYERVRGQDGVPQAPIVAMEVHAGGPDLGTATAVTQAVTGRLLVDGTPQPGAPVALCDDYDLLYEAHPCRAGAPRYEATTAADGGFRFDAVPRERYTFLAKLGDGWTVVLGAHCCSDMDGSGPVALGDIALSRDD